MSCPIRTPGIADARIIPIGGLGGFVPAGRSVEFALVTILLASGAMWFWPVFGAVPIDLGALMVMGLVGTTTSLLLCVALQVQRRQQPASLRSSRSSAAAQHDAELYRAVVDTAADAIVLSDQRGAILSFNRAAELIFGYSERELLGSSVQVLMPGDQWTAHEGHIARYLDTRIPHVIGIGRDVEGRRKDGTLFPLHLSIAEWHNGGNEIGFTAIMRDVTEQHEARRALLLAKDRAETAAVVESELRSKMETANSELKAANQALQQFTSIVAHDLRAPLGRISAFVDALRTDHAQALDDEGKDMLMRMDRGACRMQVMLNSLLGYSRHNTKAVEGKTADLVSVIADVVEHCDFRRFEPNIHVNFHDVPRAKGDPSLLAHVFQNLIGNSIKFRREDSLRIDIHGTMLDEMIQICVTDNGIGIEPRFADKIFDMFCRLHDDDEFEGAGIGLTVCRKIITDHGGRIWVDTTYVDGARIFMTLWPDTAAQHIGGNAG